MAVIEPAGLGLLATAGQHGRDLAAIVRAARMHLDMDMAYIAEGAADGSRLVRQVDCRLPQAPLVAGMRLAPGEGLCGAVMAGCLPELVADTALLPQPPRPLPGLLSVGAHLAVPIALSDGRCHGVLCCVRLAPDPSLNARDLGLLRALARLAAEYLDQELSASRASAEMARRIDDVIAQGRLRMVYQPIYRLGEDWSLCGVECLSRFCTEPARRPDQWFQEASAAGLGPVLELAAMRLALGELATLPGDFHVAVNCSPETALAPELAEVLARLPPQRLVLEITEHAHVEDYEALRRALAGLRARGMRLAIDDAGAGYASLRHILSLQPDLIKLDISLIRSINHDPMRHALASALVEFARRTGSAIIAEGVETAGELGALHALGVQRAQGYFMSMPLTLAELRQQLQAAAAA